MNCNMYRWSQFTDGSDRIKKIPSSTLSIIAFSIALVRAMRTHDDDGREGADEHPSQKDLGRSHRAAPGHVGLKFKAAARSYSEGWQ
jgi:hypothetical protein